MLNLTQDQRQILKNNQGIGKKLVIYSTNSETTVYGDTVKRVNSSNSDKEGTSDNDDPAVTLTIKKKWRQFIF